MENYTVYVRRQPYSSDSGGEIPLDDIWDIHWDNITGGIRRRTSTHFLMGYISEETACQGNVKHSGLHNYEKHGIKTCIIKRYTDKQVWKYLIEQYGPSPDAGMRKGKAYCTTQIILLLKEQPSHILTRGALREKLKALDYDVPRIRNALKRLYNTERILLEGSSQSSKQIVRLPE